MLRYRTPAGDEVILDDYTGARTVWELFGRTGAAAPPVEFTDETFATGYTETIACRVLPRDITIPLVIRGQSISHRDQVLNQITNRLIVHGIQNSLGRLIVEASNGRKMYLNCVYSGGLEAISDDDPLIYKMALNFHAADPYWYDDELQEVLLSDPTQSGLYFGDTFYFGNDTYFIGGLYSDLVEIENEGQLVYPVVTITGPIEKPRIVQDSAVFELYEDFRLNMGETLRVDFRDRSRSIQLIRDNEVEDVTHFLASGATLVFPFKSGTNRIQLIYSGSGSTTTIRIEYRTKRYSL